MEKDNNVVGHPHAHLMLLYAHDAMETDKPWERWEISNVYTDHNWVSCVTSPTWGIVNKYRRKPQIININGHKVKEPVRQPLNIGDEYCLVSTSGDYYLVHCKWQDSDSDWRRLRDGLIHLKEEDAEKHALALLSFFNDVGEKD